MKLTPAVAIETGNQNSKMATRKPEVSVFLAADMLETILTVDPPFCDRTFQQR